MTHITVLDHLTCQSHLYPPIFLPLNFKHRCNAAVLHRSLPETKTVQSLLSCEMWGVQSFSLSPVFGWIGSWNFGYVLWVNWTAFRGAVTIPDELDVPVFQFYTDTVPAVYWSAFIVIYFKCLLSCRTRVEVGWHCIRQLHSFPGRRQPVSQQLGSDSDWLHTQTDCK